MMDAEPALKKIRKSRFGCRNCKLRKLKCDEARPQCRRCCVYGVHCNFDLGVKDLQPLHQASAAQHCGIWTREGGSSITQPRASISNAIWTSDGLGFHMIDRQDQELFNRFRYRTLYTLGGAAMVDVFESHMLELSFTCPFLMHGTLAVTSVHDRYLGATPTHHSSLRESYHWSQCTVQFNKWLSQPIKEEHKDPLWATAGTLGVLTFSAIHSCSPEEAWPLGPPDSADLEWLRLGAGKMTLWELVNPLRPESAFRNMRETFAGMHQTLPSQGIDGMQPELARLCGLDDLSTQESNPYFAVAHSLSRVDKPLHSKSDAPLGGSMMVLGHMNHEFGALLREKDPVALLLLSLWYADARKKRWWLDFRARYELPAIGTYLKRYHGSNSTIQGLFPPI